ncbi:MAG: hypothetical protein ACUVTX_11175 [Bacteroidales bacterium]
MPDGSVFRKIKMSNTENNLKVENVKAPYNSSWTAKDTFEISSEGDAAWIRIAEKLFRSWNEINICYNSDSICNRYYKHRVEFDKRFRWFYTRFRFVEIVEPRIKNGYPVSRFM